MNFAQKLGLLILIIISVTYVYFSFSGKDFRFSGFNKGDENQNIINPSDYEIQEEQENQAKVQNKKTVKIYILNKSGKLRSVNRVCDTTKEKSCFEFAIKSLIAAPSGWEKSKGFTSEIPSGTKLLSVRETTGNILIDLSSEFESGGGAESTYMRIKQLIKTANANNSGDTYLYINGKQASVIGGEGVMLKQPLNERSLDE